METWPHGDISRSPAEFPLKQPITKELEQCMFGFFGFWRQSKQNWENLGSFQPIYWWADRFSLSGFWSWSRLWGMLLCCLSDQPFPWNPEQLWQTEMLSGVTGIHQQTNQSAVPLGFGSMIMLPSENTISFMGEGGFLGWYWALMEI